MQAATVSASAAANNFLDIGNKAFRNNDLKTANENYKLALHEDPKFAEAYYRLGLTALQQLSFARSA